MQILDTEAILQAIIAIYSSWTSRKEISTEKILQTVAEYYSVPEDSINKSELMAALRKSEIALPRPKLRGSSHIKWNFVNKNFTPLPKTKNKERNYKQKPVMDSLKLKLG